MQVTFDSLFVGYISRYIKPMSFPSFWNHLVRSQSPQSHDDVMTWKHFPHSTFPSARKSEGLCMSLKETCNAELVCVFYPISCWTNRRSYWTWCRSSHLIVMFYIFAAGLGHSQLQIFEAECTDVNLIGDTVYSRVLLGDCVMVDYGHLGCKVEMVAQMDAWCSGRQTCYFEASDLHILGKCQAS